MVSVEHKELVKNRNLRQLVGKIQRFVDYLKNREDFDTTFYEFGDGVGISRKNKILFLYYLFRFVIQ